MKPFPALVHDELERARSLHPGAMPTLEHGYAVLREDVDEFWEEVRKRDANLAAVLSELVQIGAMAQRVAEEVAMPELGYGEVKHGPAVSTERDLHPSQWEVEPFESDCGKACTPNGCMGHEERDVIQSITIGGAEFELTQRSVEGEVEWANTVRACQKLREVIDFYVKHHPLDPPPAPVTGSDAWSSVG